jgi:hypothetical protein
MKKILLIILVSMQYVVQAATITELEGFYRNGQVFLTWQNVSELNAFYKVYRSTAPITSGTQLSNCEYLGYTDTYSAKDWNLSRQDNAIRYLRIDSAGIPLSTSTGLFVATTLQNGNYYYAITVMIDDTEDKTIIAGRNSLAAFLSETVSDPMPVFQEARMVDGKQAYVYSTFFSTKYAIGKPLMNKSGFVAFDFGLYKNTGSGLRPLRIKLHGGGKYFLDKVTTAIRDEMVIGAEDNLPCDLNQGFWGANENFDFYDLLKNTIPPTSGVNYNITQLRINRILDWAFTYLEVDTNSVYIDGISLGAPGAYFMAITYPERFAAVRVTVGLFNFGFDQDYQPTCSFNTGKANREDGDNLLGTRITNLPSNLGYGTYDIVNGGFVIHELNQKDYPFIFSLNGKHDLMMGWTEKTIYYDSVNKNNTGGYYFWDGRSHNGDGSTWNAEDVFDLFRYRKDLSYPAFSNCSLNEDWGNGDGNTGEDFGSVNGSLDWVNEVSDEINEWEAQLFIRDLQTKTGAWVIYPSSCTADITLRRTQYFNPKPGDNINWSIHHNGIEIQSGSQIFAGGLVTIHYATIFKDTIEFTVHCTGGGTTWYADTDNDDYGDPANYITSSSQPEGYVANAEDCNDHNEDVHPGANDLCNGIDDNCNTAIDENAITANITPSGNVSVCSGTAVVLAANTGSGITYKWYKNGVAISGETKSTYSPKKTASYTVVENNTFGCTSTSAATSVTFLTLPAATITPLGDLNICLTGSVLLQANAGTGYTYRWKKGANFLTGQTNQNYTATTKGTYRVEVTNSSGCSKLSAGISVTKVCTKSFAEEDASAVNILLYPNPNAGSFVLSIQSPQDASITIRVINKIGQCVYSTQFSSSENTHQLSMPPGIPSGIYVLQVIAAHETYMVRFLIQYP